MNILIIEDDENKRQQLETFLRELLPNSSLVHKKSYNSGLREVLNTTACDLVLLDMSMPTYDVGLDEDGGRPQHYAGRAILRQMNRRTIKIPVIVVTQYDVFGEGTERLTRDQLDSQLSYEHSGIYMGTVYYNAAFDGWKTDLKDIIFLFLKNRRRSDVTDTDNR